MEIHESCVKWFYEIWQTFHLLEEIIEAVDDGSVLKLNESDVTDIIEDIVSMYVAGEITANELQEQFNSQFPNHLDVAPKIAKLARLVNKYTLEDIDQWKVMATKLNLLILRGK